VKIIVTGSAGFIGRHLTRHLADLGHQVWGLDRHDPPVYDQRVEPLPLDLLDRDGLVAAFRRIGPAGLIHLAAEVLTDATDLSGYPSNIEGVENLLEAVRSTAELKRAVYTSSQLVCKVGHVPQSDTEYCPDTVYGRSKVLTEQLVRAQDGGGVEWCLARPTTIWGPHQNPHYYRLFELILAGRYFHVGHRKRFKSYGYIDNCVHQYERLLTTPAAGIQGRALYLADYEPLALQEWTAGLAAVLGAPKIHTLPVAVARPLAWCGDLLNLVGWRSFPFNSFRLRNVLTEYIFDLEPTRQVCGALPRSLDEGLQATGEWYLEYRKAGRDSRH